MRRREVERIARGAVPGSGAPRVSLLSAGLTHDTYRVERGGCAFSMRLASRHASAQDGAWLLRVLRLAAGQALTSPVVCGDSERGIIVQKWIEGRALPAAAVRVARNVERIAATLQRVHALPVPAEARASSPRMWVGYYSAALAAQRRAARPSIERAAAALLAAAADRQLSRLEALPDIKGVICHSDLHRLNVLEYRPALARAKGLLLLDWEYAHVSEPFWDLAGWSANNDFTDDLRRRLLAAYLGRAPDEAGWMRCKLLGWLYDYVCLLWSELYLYSRHGGAESAVGPRAAVLRARLMASGV
jgi:aminoglycoside phosphotransferase (APT) family kinase protein